MALPPFKPPNIKSGRHGGKDPEPETESGPSGSDDESGNLSLSLLDNGGNSYKPRGNEGIALINSVTFTTL